MNVRRVLTLVQEIRELDQRVGAQNKLTELAAAADALANEPQNQAHQGAFIGKLTELREVLQEEEDGLNTGQRDFLRDINALNLFSSEFAEEVQEQIRDNGIAPSVVRKFIARGVKTRQAVLTNFETLSAALSSIGVKKDELEPGFAELGFIVPRSMFTNQVKGLAKEIAFVDNVVRTFTEVVLNEDFEEPKLGQLSTSDPIITMTTLVAVATVIGGTITWLLDSYKKTLEIKRARDDAVELGMKKDVVSAYQERADEVIAQAIKERVKQVMKLYKGPKERGKELEIALKWAMESLVYKMERGLRVEVRYLPPPAAEANVAEDATASEERKLYTELETIQARLLYPEICGEPILQLPPPAEPPKTRKARVTKAAKKPTGEAPPKANGEAVGAVTPAE